MIWKLTTLYSLLPERKRVMSILYYTNNSSYVQTVYNGKKVRLEDLTFKSDLLNVLIEGMLGIKPYSPTEFKRPVKSITMERSPSGELVSIKIDP